MGRSLWLFVPAVALRFLGLSSFSRGFLGLTLIFSQVLSIHLYVSH